MPLWSIETLLSISKLRVYGSLETSDGQMQKFSLSRWLSDATQPQDSVSLCSHGVMILIFQTVGDSFY